MKLKGRWYITLYGAENEVKEYREGNNVIATAGVSALVEFLRAATSGPTTNTFRYVAVGSGTAAEAATDLALADELARHTATVSALSAGIYRLTATFVCGTATGAISEYGTFNSSAAGTLLNRDVEAVVNKGANDDLVVTTEITFT